MENTNYDNYNSIQSLIQMLRQITNICSKAVFPNFNAFGFVPLYSNILKFSFAQKKQANPLTLKFSELGSATKEQEIIANGRSWFAYELRIKSTEDLHKLWYVCVRQKNILRADAIIQKKHNMKDTTKYRLQKLKKTMSRILTVIDERAQIRKKYRENLEKEYIERKRTQLQKQVASQPEPFPEITWDILRSKYQQLRRGIDNVDYLERIWQQKDLLAQRKKRGQIRSQKLASENQKFKSFWEKEMTYEQRPTQEQILRAHVTNWRQLNLKQRKIILGFLNAKRAKDAKTELVKELKVLGQKLAHQQIKERAQAK